jgi:hypothetical protein
VSRFTEVAGEHALFHTMPITTALTANYTAGDASVSVTSTTGFLRETGGSYLIEITGDDGLPFLLTGTGIGATSVTGLGATAVLGTTAAAATSGAVVRCLAYIEDNPFDAALKILCSTGAGTNGTYDTLPSSWGFGVPEGLIDLDQVQLWRSVAKPTSGSVDWRIYSAEPQTNALGWLAGVLQQGGIWLTQAEGRIALRAILAPGDKVPGGIPQIGDSVISDLSSYSTWDGATPVEYDRVLNVSPTITVTSSAGTVASRPAIKYLVRDADYVDLNVTAWLTEINGRISAWSTRIPETVEVTLIGWQHAELGPGSWAALTTSYLTGRQWGGGALAGGQMLVTACQVDWFGSETTIRLSSVPLAESEVT